MPKFRGKVKPGQTVVITCRCGRRLSWVANEANELMSLVDEMGREVERVTRAAADAALEPRP